MRQVVVLFTLSLLCPLLFAESENLQAEIKNLTKLTQQLQKKINILEQQISNKKPAKQQYRHSQMQRSKEDHSQIDRSKIKTSPSKSPVVPPLPMQKKLNFHTHHVTVHALNGHPESLEFYPTVLMAKDEVITFIAGTPVVSSPYTGARPAFDGSDYIINISSINRDIRLMQQRRRLYQAFEFLGYPTPNVPILTLSGKVEPVASVNNPFRQDSAGDLNLGSSELDVTALLNDTVEAFIAMAYDDSPPVLGGARVTNSVFRLNSGFINIGDLERSPFYFTAGQLYVPFGRYSSSMISSPLPLILARTKSRPVILGFKSQNNSGPYAAVYGFKSETTQDHSGIGGVNIGYAYSGHEIIGDFGMGLIGTITDSAGMQNTESPPYTTFGGFSSLTNGSEAISTVPGFDIHGNISVDRYSLTAEWVTATTAFRPQDLSFNGHGARPQAAQIEGGVTFKLSDKPASLGLGYQWSKETLALNMPKKRINAVFNISLWRDTVESIEFRHDIDFSAQTYANGAAPPGVINQNTYGTGHSANTILGQIGVYF